MPPRDDAHRALNADSDRDAPIVRVAFWITLFSAFGWPAHALIALLLGGLSALARSPGSLIVGAATAGTLGISAYLLSVRKWQGAAIASLMYLGGTAIWLRAARGRTGLTEIAILASLAISLLALRALWPGRAQL